MKEKKEATELGEEISIVDLLLWISKVKKWPFLLFGVISLSLAGKFYLSRTTHFEANATIWVDEDLSRGRFILAGEQPYYFEVPFEVPFKYSKEGFAGLMRSKQFRTWLWGNERVSHAKAEISKKSDLGEGEFMSHFSIGESGDHPIRVTTTSSTDTLSLSCASDYPGVAPTVVDLTADLFLEYLGEKRDQVLEEMDANKQREIDLFIETVGSETPESLASLEDLKMELVRIRASKNEPVRSASILQYSDGELVVVSPSLRNIISIPMVLFLFLSFVYVFASFLFSMVAKKC